MKTAGRAVLRRLVRRATRRSHRDGDAEKDSGATTGHQKIAGHGVWLEVVAVLPLFELGERGGLGAVLELGAGREGKARDERGAGDGRDDAVRSAYPVRLAFGADLDEAGDERPVFAGADHGPSGPSHRFTRLELLDGRFELELGTREGWGGEEHGKERDEQISGHESSNT